MPTSPSPQPGIDAAAATRKRYLLLFCLIVLLAVATVVAVVLPASLIQRLLPPAVSMQDFSGSLWHGSAGTLIVSARNAGAIEWHVHPGALLHMTLSADVHWVKVGFVADGAATVDRAGMTLRGVRGGGPVADLQDLGVPADLRGIASFKFSVLATAFADANGGGRLTPTLTSAVGDFALANLALPQIAGGADLGGYVLHFADGAITPDADATAELHDTGGPLEVHATITLAGGGRSGLLSGTVAERPAAPPAIHKELQQLTQLHARDAEGRVPVDLEFTF